MKFIKKNLKHLFNFIFIGLLLGTLLFEMFILVLNHVGLQFPLSVGPIGFDLDIISFFIKINLGSLLGAGAGMLLFKRL